MHLTLSKISSMSDSSAERETDQESLADWTLVDHEEESIVDDNGGELDGENSPPEETEEEGEKEGERDSEEEEEDVVALGQKVEEVKDGDTESLDSEPTSPETKLWKRRSRKSEATQDEETDLSLASCPSLPDDLPAIKPDSQYIHHPDKELNTRLNVIVALTIACVLGLGFGHFVGWSSRSLWEENLNAAQVRKLRELQDNLLSCMSTSPSSTDGVSPSLPPQCHSKYSATPEKAPFEDAHVPVLHQNDPSPPQDNFLHKFVESQDARVTLGPTPFFESSFEHPVTVSKIPPGDQQYTSEALFYSVIPIQETRYDALEAGRGLETTFEADPVSRIPLTERLVDVIKPPEFPNRSPLKPDRARSFIQPAVDRALKSDTPRIVPPAPGFFAPLDFTGESDERFFSDLTTIDIITHVESEQVLSTGDDRSHVLTSTAAMDRRDKEFVSAMSPDFGTPVSSSNDVETSQGILVESIRSDASNKVRHIIYKDHRISKDPPSPDRLEIYRDELLAEESSVTLDGLDFKIETAFEPSDEGSLSIKDQLEREIWHTQNHLYPSAMSNLDREERLAIKKFPLYTREIQDVDSGSPFFVDTNALDDTKEEIRTYEEDNYPPYWIDTNSGPHFSEDYSTPLIKEESVFQRSQSNGIKVDMVSSWNQKHCETSINTSPEEGCTIDDTSQPIDAFDQEDIPLDSSENPHRYASPSTDFVTNHQSLDPIELKYSQVLESLKAENALLEQQISALQSKNLEPIRIKGREGREARALREHISLLITENEDMRLALGRHHFSTLPGGDKADFNRAAQDNHHLRTTVSQLKHLGPDLQELQSSVKLLQNQHHSLLVKVGKIRYEQPLPKELTPLVKQLEEMKLVVAEEAKKPKPPNSIYNAKSYITFMTQVLSAFTNIHNFDEKSAIEKIDLAKDALVYLFPKGFKVSEKVQADILVYQEHFTDLKKSLQQKWKQLKDLTKPETIVDVGKSTISKMNRVIVNVVNKVKEIAQSTIMNGNKQIESSIVSLSDNLNKLNQQFEEAWKSLEIRKDLQLDDTHFEDVDLNDEDENNLNGDDFQPPRVDSDNTDETARPQPDGSPLTKSSVSLRGKPSPPAAPPTKPSPTQTHRQVPQLKEVVQKQKIRKEQPNNVPKNLEESAPIPSKEIKGKHPSVPTPERFRDAKTRQTKPREEKKEDKKNIQGQKLAASEVAPCGDQPTPNRKSCHDKKDKILVQDDSRYFKGQYNKFDKNKLDPTDLKTKLPPYDEAEDEDDDSDNKNEKTSSGLRRHWDKPQGKKSIFRDKDGGASKQFIPRRG